LGAMQLTHNCVSFASGKSECDSDDIA